MLPGTWSVGWNGLRAWHLRRQSTSSSASASTPSIAQSSRLRRRMRRLPGRGGAGQPARLVGRRTRQPRRSDRLAGRRGQAATCGCIAIRRLEGTTLRLRGPTRLRECRRRTDLVEGDSRYPCPTTLSRSSRLIQSMLPGPATAAAMVARLDLRVKPSSSSAAPGRSPASAAVQTRCPVCRAARKVGSRSTMKGRAGVGGARCAAASRLPAPRSYHRPAPCRTARGHPGPSRCAPGAVQRRPQPVTRNGQETRAGLTASMRRWNEVPADASPPALITAS